MSADIASAIAMIPADVDVTNYRLWRGQSGMILPWPKSMNPNGAFNDGNSAFHVMHRAEEPWEDVTPAGGMSR